MANKILNPFVIENQRAKLAKKKDYKRLKITYTSKYPEIKDLNTPQLWDHLHYGENKSELDHPMANDRLQIVTNLIKEGTVSVLDIGFGSASLERFFFKKHKQKKISWSGIEISSLLVKKAKKEFPYCRFTVGNISKLNYKNDVFDYVIALEVLEHIRPRDTFKALEEIYRIVKPGKYLIISVPMNEGLRQMIAKGINPNAHVRTYTPELIKAELEIVGFNVLFEQTLFAFPNFYRLKTFIAKKILRKKFCPNNIIIFAQKPI